VSEQDSFSMTPSRLIKRPAGLNELAGKVFEVLAQHTAFPWPILETQSKRAKKDPLQLTREDLTELAPRLIEALGRFAAPDKTKAAQIELMRLIAG
jgi:hypothetical protein